MRFPVSIGNLPTGNVVLIAENVNALPPGLNLDPPLAPTLAIRTNPVDPYGKVLIVTGNNPDQTLMAAQALATGWPGLQGATAAVNQITLPAKSARRRRSRAGALPTIAAAFPSGPVPPRPCRATATSRSSPTTKFLPTSSSATRSRTSSSISTTAITPSPSAPSPASRSSRTTLTSARFRSSPAKKSRGSHSVNIAIPIVNLRPFSNSMRFRFTFQLLKGGNCNTTIPGNQIGAILRSSYIDLQGLPHWASMPNLELFSNAGFPFTRYADLSQTTVVLPDEPSSQEIETYLTMMGHFGAETGFPALRVTVAGPEALQSGADQDFLVIATGQTNGDVGRLASEMPVTFGDNSLKVQDTRGFFAAVHNMWWRIPANDQLSSGLIGTTGVPDA